VNTLKAFWNDLFGEIPLRMEVLRNRKINEERAKAIAEGRLKLDDRK
jgi:hypothetical protein